MVARGPGAVGCAHCTKLGAMVACGVCKHLVCEPCANDWSTCDQPWGRVFRLGTTGRLLDVDPTGRFGLVTRWRGPMRYLDLRGLRWIDGELPSLVRGRHTPPRLTSDQRVLQHDWGVGGEESLAYHGLAISRSGMTHHEPRVPLPARGTGVSLREDRFWYVTDTELVAIVRFQPPTALPAHAAAVTMRQIDVAASLDVKTYEPLPRKVIQCAFVDDARDLLVAASWGEIIVHRIVGDKLVQAFYVKTTGDVVSVAIAGRYLVAHIRGGAAHGITVWKLDDKLSIGSVALRIEDKVARQAISRDGRYLAVAMADERVLVRGLEDGTSELYDEHTDDVSCVQFVGDDQLLVTADDDNRVILRPRTPTGYARALMETQLGG